MMPQEEANSQNLSLSGIVGKVKEVKTELKNLKTNNFQVTMHDQVDQQVFLCQVEARVMKSIMTKVQDFVIESINNGNK